EADERGEERAHRGDGERVGEAFAVHGVLEEQSNVRERRPSIRIEEGSPRALGEGPNQKTRQKHGGEGRDEEGRTLGAFLHGLSRAASDAARYWARMASMSRLPSVASSTGLGEASAARMGPIAAP